ncbi:MAG: hypothetical protein IID46_02470 [Planctomycetes bacterium]|nr:hypothetical protein [Planctomycetota bacterium]
MPDKHYDPSDSGSQANEPQQDDDDHSTLPEADEQETYGLGKPIELPELSPPPRPAIEPLETEHDEPSSETSSKRPVHREQTEKEDPLVGDSMVSALWYPLSGHGFRVLSLFTILFWLCPFVPFLRMIIVLITGSYAGLLLLETVAFTMQRIEIGPRLPEFGFDSLQSGMYALSVVVIAELPLFIVQMMFAGSDLSPLIMGFLTMGSIFFVMYYVPMGLIAIAEIEDVSALNPLFVFRGIRKMGRIYFILVTTAVLSFAVPYLLLNVLGIHWILVALVCSFCLVYSLIALMRAVAIVFRDRGIQLAETE